MCVCVCVRARVCVPIHVCMLPFLTCLSETIAGVWLYLYQEGSGLTGGMSPPSPEQPDDKALGQESRDTLLDPHKVATFCLPFTKHFESSSILWASAHWDPHSHTHLAPCPWPWLLFCGRQQLKEI